MTLQEAKDQVAKKNGFTSWEDSLTGWFKRTGQYPVVHELYVEQVAKLYAEKTVFEFCEWTYKAMGERSGLLYQPALNDRWKAFQEYKTKTK